MDASAGQKCYSFLIIKVTSAKPVVPTKFSEVSIIKVKECSLSCMNHVVVVVELSLLFF